MSEAHVKHRFSVGDVIQGYGLNNAGRFYTVKDLGRSSGRIYIEEHLTGREFWTSDIYYRLAE